ncbi:MAG: endonuclease III domain-containing protein [Gammaproteobacteria bacterium]
MLHRQTLLEIYRRLLAAYGNQNWWPADTPFEMMLGAILTQNTAWQNVEKAIANLKQAEALNLTFLLNAEPERLAALVRPSGYFNIKAQRLQNFARWFQEQGRYRQLARLDDMELRQRLLSVNGIGPETADDILLYAFKRPVFVIDAYTRRLLLEFGLIQGDEGYETLRQAFETALDPDVDLFQEYHALIVRHAKQSCSADPDCRHCTVIAPLCE